MPRNIIDKLAWWISNKEKREVFRYNINKTVIDSLVNNQEEFKSRYPDLYNKIIYNFLQYLTNNQEEFKSIYPNNITYNFLQYLINNQEEFKSKYPDLYNKVTYNFLQYLTNNQEEFKSRYPDLYNKVTYNFLQYLTNNQEEFKSRYPDLYNNITNSFFKHLENMPKKEFVETYPKFYHNIKNNKTRNSQIINKYLLGLKGIEIGGASYADYGIDAINIDRIDTNVNNNIYYDEQTKNSGYLKKVDLISKGDDLPFKDNTIDFVFTSHVIEHFYDPIKALKEWYRVIKKDGYIFIIAPHKERTFDKDRERTTLQELIDRHKGTLQSDNQFDDAHHSVWITEDFLELCKYLNFNVVEYQDVDDFMGIGFTIVIKK